MWPIRWARAFGRVVSKIFIPALFAYSRVFRQTWSVKNISEIRILYQIYIETFFYALIFIFLQRWPVFLLSFGGKSLHISVLQLENERGRALVKDRGHLFSMPPRNAWSGKPEVIQVMKTIKQTVLALICWHFYIWASYRLL